MTPYDTKLTYPKVGGAAIVEACKDKPMVFSYLDRHIVAEFELEDGNPHALRLGDNKILTPIDVYPELGLVTFAGAFTIKYNY